MYLNKDIEVLVVKHTKSFVKTYVTSFIAIALFAYDQGTDVFTVPFLIINAKISLIAAVRTVYKLLTEDVKLDKN